MIKMVGYVQSLDRLGYPISEEFATDIILNSLPSAYGQFISNYHMHGMDKKLTELHGMLKQAEADLKKGTSQVLMVQNKPKFKKSSWTKKKKTKSGGSAPDPNPSSSSGTKSTPLAGSTCFLLQGGWSLEEELQQVSSGAESQEWRCHFQLRYACLQCYRHLSCRNT